MSTNNICFYGEIWKIIPKIFIEYTPYLNSALNTIAGQALLHRDNPDDIKTKTY